MLLDGKKYAEAKLPELYSLIGSTTILIPTNLSELSLNSATASLGMFFAIVTDFVLLYPFCDNSYLIAIIFLISYRYY